VVVAVVTVEAVVRVPSRIAGVVAVVRGVRGGDGGRVAGGPPEPSDTTPRGMAVGGGSDSRRPTPVSTPRKNSSEAPRTAAAAFTNPTS
jgi:hypothetical protein